MLFLPWALAALPALVSAGVQFTSPTAGSTVQGGGSITVEWSSGGDGPAISDLLTYELSLWAGGNTDTEMYQVRQFAVPGSSFATTGNKASAVVTADLGGSTKNAYFFKIVSVAKTGGQLIQYSSRFSLSGMTGAFPANVVTALASVTGTDGPPDVDNTQNAAVNPSGGDFNVPYTMQTGPIRYAPMQPVPPTKITQKVHTPQYPTSAILTTATTFLPIPKQKSTTTMVQTFSVSSRENTAAAAPHPTDDMAKYLARWRD